MFSVVTNQMQICRFCYESKLFDKVIATLAENHKPLHKAELPSLGCTATGIMVQGHESAAVMLLEMSVACKLHSTRES